MHAESKEHEPLGKIDPEAAQPSVVEMRGVYKAFGSNPVLQDINLAVKANEVLALLGPSGCGKSTILKLLAGFFPPNAGSIHLGGKVATHLPPHKRNLGMVFQDYSLFPHLNVYDNVGFGLAVRGRARAVIRDRVSEALSLVGLAEMGERFPSQLSGGQKQRIAIARALAIDPTVLLCDEPLSNLDAKLRKDILLQLKRLQRETKVTMVYVTHDQEEAVILADRIVLLNHGRIEQIGDSRSIFERPATRFAAEFMGYTNFLEGIVEQRPPGSTIIVLPQGFRVRLAEEVGQPGSNIRLCVRDERIQVGSVQTSTVSEQLPQESKLMLRASIAEVVYTGTSYLLLCDCGSGLVLRARLSAPQFVPGAMSVGAAVVLSIQGRDIRALNEAA